MKIHEAIQLVKYGTPLYYRKQDIIELLEKLDNTPATKKPTSTTLTLF